MNGNMGTKTKWSKWIGLVATALAFPTVALAQDVNPAKEAYEAPKKEYSPYVGDHFPTRVLWGDTHLHTSWSVDAGFLGGTLDPEGAYRASMGQEVTSSNGFKFKLVRPLDFVVVSDHAESFGLLDFINRSDPIILKDPLGKMLHDLIKAGKGFEAFQVIIQNAAEGKGVTTPEMMRSAWEKATTIAEKYNQPGAFTALIGYEFSPHPAGNNLHRVVIFRDNKDRADQVRPMSSFDSNNPEDLWKYMAGYEEKTGGRVLDIAHNGNLSNGLMFDTKTYEGNPLTQAYAETRSRFEPVYEVTQAKGTGEAHPALSPDDEFAGQELLDASNIMGRVPKTLEMLPKEYARPALMEGLRQEEKLGVNPFKFGMIGSTDNHTSLPSTREDNWFGKAPILEPSAERWEDVLVRSPVDPKLSIYGSELSAAGLAGVWARENTRKSIWDAMARREVYATTGSRISVRVFGGWEFTADEVERADFAREGYSRGVPMGGDLTKGPNGVAPSFMIRALRDPDNANLDRVQVIKGWLDADGNTHERIYDVVCSDGRAIAERRCDKPVGSTVDVANASYTNTIGDPLLTAHWIDPDFDPKLRAFYYVRVIEIPKPRWTAYDAKFFKIKMPDNVAMTVQDRAYTSPIWYTP
ncbi:MAG: DUF3604 domain-containing protein [Gammaproteobacteria bacterium]